MNNLQNYEPKLNLNTTRVDIKLTEQKLFKIKNQDHETIPQSCRNAFTSAVKNKNFGIDR